MKGDPQKKKGKEQYGGKHEEGKGFFAFQR
jgi:hypothetical protein